MNLGLQTEFEFSLPKGYVDRDGTLHRQGVMRLATALDEITPLRDPRVKNNPAYLVILLLSRVIVRLGSLASVSPQVIENMYAADLAYLQAFYRQINEMGASILPVTCPACGSAIEVDLADVGGS